MAIVRLDSMMTSMIDIFRDMITIYHDYQRSQNEEEFQVENEEITVLPGKLDEVNSVTKENS